MQDRIGRPHTVSVNNQVFLRSDISQLALAYYQEIDWVLVIVSAL